MKILITGGAGFLGSNLVHKLYKNNNIYVIDNLSTGNINNIKQLIKTKKIKFIKADISDVKLVKKIRRLKFDMIYNFACPASPQYYLKFPVETWISSVYGVKNLLDSIIFTKTKLFHSSTSEIYGNPLEYPQTESYFGNVNSIGVRACYDEGKRAAEAIIYDYIRKYNVDVRVARIFNTYGIRMQENDGRVISNFICAAINSKPILIHGDGKQTRSFCYVDDTLNAIEKLMLLEEKIKTPINIGNPTELTINEIATIIKNKINKKCKIIHVNEMKDDPKVRKPNIDLAKKVLDWEPNIDLEKGLDKTFEYFKN